MVRNISATYTRLHFSAWKFTILFFICYFKFCYKLQVSANIYLGINSATKGDLKIILRLFS